MIMTLKTFLHVLRVTEIENIQRVEIIRVKGKYREVGNEYEKIRVKVEEFVPHGECLKN